MRVSSTGLLPSLPGSTKSVISLKYTKLGYTAHQTLGLFVRAVL